jgi:hypothetical protein
MFSQNQVQTLMLGKASVSLTAGAIKPSALAVGEIGAFTQGGTKYIESASAPGLPFVLYKKMADGTLLKSEVISLATVEKVIRKDTTAAAEKVEYYGSNGTTGSIEALDENFYRLRIEMKEGYATNNHGTDYTKHAIYESDATATQYEIASGLASSGFSNFSREPKNSSGQAPIVFKAICDNAGVANGITAGGEWTHLTFIQGSKYVTGTISGATSGCLGTDEDIDTVVAGDFLRAGTATTSDMYKIVAKTVGTATTPLIIELDKPYRGASANIAAASTEYVTAALGAAANWGIVLTGQSQDFLVGKKAYVKVDWNSTAEDFGTTTYTASANTAMNPGINVYEQIAEMEWFLQGNEGNKYHGVGYPIADALRAEVENTAYETIDIIYRDTLENNITRTSNRKVLTIAIPTSNPDFWTNGSDGLADVLGDLLTGAPMYGGITTNNGAPMVAGDLD